MREQTQSLVPVQRYLIKMLKMWKKINSRRNVKERYQQRTPAAELTPLRNADTKIISSVDCIRKGVIGYDKLTFLMFSHTDGEKQHLKRDLNGNHT